MRLRRNRLRGTDLPWPTTLPITMSASSRTAIACIRSSASLAEVVVVVDEEHVVAARELDAEVARPPGPARVGDVLDADVGVLGGERVEPRRRRVGRAVVDEDHLVLVGRQRLAEQRPDAVVDVAARVVDRDDDGDLHEAGWTAGAGS